MTLNKNVTNKNRDAVIAELQKRQAAGKLGANDAKRLSDLTGQTVAPNSGGTSINAAGINDSINTKTGQIINPDDVLGQKKTFDPTDPYWKDLYKNTYENTYGLATAHLDERQTREMEAAKQEAADRGLPYDPSNRESAYGKVTGAVTDKYNDLYQGASQQAYQAAESAYTAQGGLANQGYAAYLQGVLGISEADARAKANEIAKYGIDADTKSKMAAIAASGKKSGGSAKPAGGTSGFDVTL